LVLTPGVYTFNSNAQLTGSLTLNAQGNPNAVFIFKIGTTLITSSSSSVNVIGGGQGTNVFWQVGSSATLGTTTSFVGDILADEYHAEHRRQYPLRRGSGAERPGGAGYQQHLNRRPSPMYDSVAAGRGRAAGGRADR
jgi:hypothetical protein